MSPGDRPSASPNPSALSPLDGRYRPQMAPYAGAFSEEGLIRQRFKVEVRWLLALASDPAIGELGPLDDDTAAVLNAWVDDFGPDDVAEVKRIEARTNHDVKAVEYLFKAKLAAIGWSETQREFVHFAATSEDVNNLAHALMLNEGIAKAWLPEAESLIGDVAAVAAGCADMAMLSHTHGQPASPTTLGKELAVFCHRWSRQVQRVRSLELTGKWNGAVGTFGAHVAAYPEVEWISLSRRFVESFGLEWNPLTTQIEPHDTVAELFHTIVRFNSILLDFCRDMWEYVSRSYLRQRVVAGEVGSSTMPHKVNPIDFENAEANAGVSSALLEHLASKLMVSRMQRDLSDSSALRNVGVALGHSGLAITSARRGFAKVTPDADTMAADLDCHWEVLGEAIQTAMRRHGIAEPYERLKELTRGREVGPAEVREFVAQLHLPAEAAERLTKLTPSGYTGLAAELVTFAVPNRGASAAADRESKEPAHTPA